MDVSPETGQFKTKKRIQYSRDELMELQNNPQSNYRPKELAPAFYSPTTGKWDPVEWHRSFSRSKTPVDEEKKDFESTGVTKKRHFDPKERLKDEHDKNIVLSPQRCSFFSGCHVNDPKSSSTDRDLKRVGSARLSKEGKDLFQRRQRNDWDESHRSSFSESEDLGRSLNDKRSAWRGRQHKSEEEETPEWYSEGPTSQYDTIELRGLYEPEPTTEQPTPPPVEEEETKVERKSPEATYPTERRTSPDGRASGEFDINDFLRLDLPDLLPTDNAASSSRFFSSYGVQEEQESSPRHSTVPQENVNLIPEVSRDSSSQQLNPSVFLPPSNKDGKESIVEMLQKAADKDRVTPDELFQTGPHSIKALALEGKAKNLAEVEAGLHSGSDGDMSAFKKLLAQVNTGSLIPAAQFEKGSRSMGTTPLRNSPQPQPMRATKDDMHAALVGGFGGAMHPEPRINMMISQPPPPAIVDSFANIRYAQPPQHQRPQPKVAEAHMLEEKKAKRDHQIKTLDHICLLRRQTVTTQKDIAFLTMMREAIARVSNYSHKDLVRSGKELEFLAHLLQDSTHTGVQDLNPDVLRTLAVIGQPPQHPSLHQMPEAAAMYQFPHKAFLQKFKGLQLEEQPRMNVPPPVYQNKSSSSSTLSFMPTAVMRKMTAEKGATGMDENLDMAPDNLSSHNQGRPLLKANKPAAMSRFSVPPPVWNPIAFPPPNYGTPPPTAGVLPSRNLPPPPTSPRDEDNMVRRLFASSALSMGNLPQLPQALSVDELERVNL